MNNDCYTKRIGMLLQEAALVSSSQVDIALIDQTLYEDLKLGEILALRGWIKQETADFFAERWCTEINLHQRNPLGYYLKSAALLSENQIDEILKEQPKLGIRFGAIAVLKGWVRQETVDFFLDNLAPDQKSASAFYDDRQAFANCTTKKESTDRQGRQENVDSSTGTQGRKSQTLDTNLSKYASSSFFAENNLYISEAQIILPSGAENNYDLANALDYEFPKLDS